MAAQNHERLSNLRKLAGRGLLAAEIAERLGCTKNAVIGLAWRNGITLSGLYTDKWRVRMSKAMLCSWANADDERRAAAAERMRQTSRKYWAAKKAAAQ